MRRRLFAVLVRDVRNATTATRALATAPSIARSLRTHVRSCAGRRCRRAAGCRHATTSDEGYRPARSSPRPRRQLRRGSERPFFDRGEALLEPPLLRVAVGTRESLAGMLHREPELTQQPRNVMIVVAHAESPDQVPDRSTDAILAVWARMRRYSPRQSLDLAPTRLDCRAPAGSSRASLVSVLSMSNFASSPDSPDARNGALSIG
jgi:hypothetical protein